MLIKGLRNRLVQKYGEETLQQKIRRIEENIYLSEMYSDFNGEVTDEELDAMFDYYRELNPEFVQGGKQLRQSKRGSRG